MIKNYTVRDIAEELSVSKPTVSKAITELNLRLEKVGNRFVLSEEQFVLIKSQITKKSESEISEKMTEKCLCKRFAFSSSWDLVIELFSYHLYQFHKS